MLPNFQAGGFGRRRMPYDVVCLDLEGTNNSTSPFADTGTGQSSWTAGGAAVNSTTVVLDGTSSLKIPSSITDYIKTAYGANNCLPAKEGWEIEARVYSGGNWATGGVGKYIVSCQDSSATAAGTAFAIATNGGGIPVLILSDGTTRAVIATSGSAMGSTTTYNILAYRRGNTCGIGFLGGTFGTGSFTGSVNLPSSRDLRFGAPEFTTSGAETLYLDRLRIRIT